MACTWEPVELGQSGIRTRPLGVGSSYGVGAAGVRRAFDRGIGFFYWGSLRRRSFGQGLADLARTHRDDLTIVVQSYARIGRLLKPSLERALRRLGTDHADLLLLGWWNGLVSERVLDAARALVDAGRARAVMVSCHHRPTFQRFAADPRYDALMVRYNAAHPGAEEEVFPHLGARPGIVSYTATSWGRLLDTKRVPAGEPAPRGSDCYRFALTSPHVHLCLCGPGNGAQLEEALAALDRGPMSADELAWMKRVGAATG